MKWLSELTFGVWANDNGVLIWNMNFSMTNFFHARCSDGRIKVIGGDNIEGLLFSGKPVPFKYLKVCEPDAQDSCLVFFDLLPCLHFKFVVVLCQCILVWSGFPLLNLYSSKHLHCISTALCAAICFFPLFEIYLTHTYLFSLHPSSRMIAIIPNCFPMFSCILPTSGNQFWNIYILNRFLFNRFKQNRSNKCKGS